MNLPLLRREQQLQPVLDYVEEHRHTLFLPDQDVISALSGRMGRLEGVSAKTLYSNVITPIEDR